MRDPVVNVAGGDEHDQRLWNTYVYWARATFPERIPENVVISRSASRISVSSQRSLQAILFATFALEYRLRSVYAVLGLGVRRRDGLWELASNLQRRTSNSLGMNGQRIQFRAEWRRVLPRIQTLLELRNKIAHGNAGSVAGLVSARSPSIKVQARRGYNTFIDAIRVINLAIGYEDLRGRDLRNYYNAMKVRRG
jgi:hypothetical protein